MQQIHQQQFLMLFLVRVAKVQQRLDTRLWASQQTRHGIVDMAAVGHHLFQRWPCEHAALRAWLARTERFVVGIEQVAEFFRIRQVAVQMGR